MPSAEAAKIANSRGGMTEDSRDFPLHRYAVDMATDPRIGLIIGPGYYYHPGKKLTVDLGVGAQAVPAESGPNEYGVTPAVRVPGNRVALNALYLAILEVRRTDTKQLALPGGDIDPGEDPLAAALREAREETGMEFDTATSLGRRLVADPRLTSCTETESELFAIDAGEIPVQKPEGSEETDAAEWLIVNSALVARYRQFGSHRRMLFEFVDWYQQEHNVTIMEDGRIVPNA